MTIARYYGGKLSTCLMQLYPDIGLSQSHFDTSLSRPFISFPLPPYNLFLTLSDAF